MNSVRYVIDLTPDQVQQLMVEGMASPAVKAVADQLSSLPPPPRRFETTVADVRWMLKGLPDNLPVRNFGRPIHFTVHPDGIVTIN